MSQSLNDLFKKDHIKVGHSMQPIGVAIAHQDSFESQLQAAGVLNAPAPVVDMSLYKKLMTIDPGAARTFIQTRLDNIEAQITPLREEMRQLKEIISYDKNKEISSYYEKTHKIKKHYGVTAAINAFFMENIGKEFRQSHVSAHLKSMGYKIDNENAVASTLYRLHKLGHLQNPYRGVYKMEKKHE